MFIEGAHGYTARAKDKRQLLKKSFNAALKTYITVKQGSKFGGSHGFSHAQANTFDQIKRREEIATQTVTYR